MLEEVILAKGELEEAPEGSDLYNGNAAAYRTLEKEEQEALKVLQQAMLKHKMTRTPLDLIYEPRDTFVLEGSGNTVIHPPLAVRKKDSAVPEWIVDFSQDESDPVDFFIKPWVLRKGGVKEFWLVNTKDKKIYIYDLEKESLVPEIIDSPRRVKVGVYNGLYIGYTDLFKKKAE